MIRAAALVLAADLAAHLVKVHTVTIAGNMERGSAFDPDRIADAFWDLHVDPGAGPELIYTGTEPPAAGGQ